MSCRTTYLFYVILVPDFFQHLFSIYTSLIKLMDDTIGVVLDKL